MNDSFSFDEKTIDNSAADTATPRDFNLIMDDVTTSLQQRIELEQRRLPALCRDVYSFSSDEETIDSAVSITAMPGDFNMIIADLARCLQERVELEQRGVTAAQDRLSPRPSAPTVEIEGMDVLLQAMINSEDMKRDWVCSSTYSLDSTLDDSSDNDIVSVTPTRRAKRRSKFLNRGNIGCYWDLRDEFNVDSLRLTRKTMEDKKTTNHQSNLQDDSSTNSIENFDDVTDTIVMMKDSSKSSLPASSPGLRIAAPNNVPSIERIHYGNAAA
ncbi:hypothetical protein IV203_034568 [Nitzschia inconspicua]|uniref:Uncharacterized protein n=1 Tax=Nitzschia inconspicua TaxID=303405 RepID=A0A9K3PTR7_9STRA|nr:hypothetical protein IV203_034568 [Nitzschia inconspicua]